MKRPRSLLALCVACVTGIATFGDRSIRAAPSPAPTISLTRNTALNGRVWPVDLNGDGITDLVASDTFVNGSPGSILAVIGKGDGTFGSPVKSSTTGEVLAVGDFNADGKRDVLIRHVVSSTSISAVILPGNGNGTFAAPITVGTFADITFALTTDLNGDHMADLIICDESTLYLYPGNGDFTFGTPATIATSDLSFGGAIADLDGDGKPDIVVANHEGRSVSVFLNQGALNFTAAEIPLDRRANDVLAVDLNKDGRIDLVVATSTSAADNPDAYVEGYVYVMFGSGDGTFAAPVKYQAAAGTWRIVVGDFTRDGIPDIATANRSAIYYDDCTISLKTWDSISILPGNGDGTFGSASSFSLGDQGNLTNDRYRNTAESLNTSDLNGDHATDLIASWGGILKNNPADANWPPKVTASATTFGGGPEVQLMAPASDSDQDMLTYSWIDSGGDSVPPLPIVCFAPSTRGTHTYTVTVNDQHGHIASSSVTIDIGGSGGPTITVTAPASGSKVTAGTPYTITWTTSNPGGATITGYNVDYTFTDSSGTVQNGICTNLAPTATSCIWKDPEPVSTNGQITVSAMNGSATVATGTAGSVSIVSGGGGGLPSGWQSADVGHVGAAGSASYSNGVFTVKGSGADVWGTADAFHYVYRQMDQQFEMQALIDTVQNVNAWTKAGIMVRTSIDASAPQASVFVTPGHGIVFQRRTSQSSPSVSTQGPILSAPVWLRLASTYNGQIEAFYRKAITDPWTPIGYDVLSGYSTSTPLVGLAITSHANGSVATATYEHVTYGDLPTWNGGASAIGVSATDASASYDGTIFGLFSKSSDVWGTADAVMFLNAAWTGDGTITARVNSVDNTSAWAKAGVMIRETDTPGSRQVFLMVTPGKGVNLQYRATTSGTSASAASVSGVAPGWLRLQRADSTFAASWSTDGITFNTVGSVNVSMAASIKVGLAFTSHTTSMRGGAQFDDVRIDP